MIAQRLELHPRQTHDPVTHLWPDELAAFQPLVTSRGNADLTLADEHLVGVTHPFHPWFGQRLPCVGRRSNRHGERLLLQGYDGTVWSIPPQWTELANEDFEVVLGGGQALFRLTDLLALANLVDRLSGQPGLAFRKVDYAATVTENMPQDDQDG